MEVVEEVSCRALAVTDRWELGDRKSKIASGRHTKATFHLG